MNDDGTRAPDPFPLFERTGTPDDMNALDADIEVVADRLIAALDIADQTVASKAPDGLKPEAARYLAYALVVHRSRRGGVLTEDHLRLLWAALGIKRLSTRAAEEVGLPAAQDHHAFIAAANMVAHDPQVTNYQIAKRTKVDPHTVEAWRESGPFRRRVRAVRYIAGHRSEEDEAIAARWRAVIDKLNSGITS